MSDDSGLILDDRTERLLSDLTHMAYSLIKAVLKDHPDSPRARSTLYEQLLILKPPIQEISIISLVPVDVEDICLDGIPPGPQSLLTLMTRGMEDESKLSPEEAVQVLRRRFEMQGFVTRLLEALSSRGLFALVINLDIGRQQLAEFLSFLHQPPSPVAGQMALDAMGRSGLDQLADLMLLSELVGRDRGLSWRVLYTLNRLLHGIKHQRWWEPGSRKLLQFLRSQVEGLSRSDRFTELLLNLDLVSQAFLVQGIDLIKEILLLVSQEVQENLLVKLQEEQKQMVSRMRAVGGTPALKAKLDTLIQVVMLLEGTLGNEVIQPAMEKDPFLDDLPPLKEEQILSDFVSRGSFYLQRLDSTKDRVEFLEVAGRCIRAVPVMASRGDAVAVRRIVETMMRSADDGDRLPSLGSLPKDGLARLKTPEFMAALVGCINAAKAELKGHALVVARYLGQAGFNLLFDLMASHEDKQLRKMAADLLAEMGEEIEDLLYQRLADASQPWQVLWSVLYILRIMGRKERVKEILSLINHSHPKVREEVLVTVTGLVGPQAERLLSHALNDKELAVRSKAITLLGEIGTRNPKIISYMLNQVRLTSSGEEEPAEALQLAVLEAMRRLGNLQLKGTYTIESYLLSLLAPTKGEGKNDKSARVVLSILSTMASIGTAVSLARMEEVAKKGLGQDNDEAIRSKMAPMIDQLRERLGAS